MEREENERGVGGLRDGARKEDERGVGSLRDGARRERGGRGGGEATFEV